jgi:hypothetical protein
MRGETTLTNAVSEDRWFLQEPDSVRFQKTEFFVVTAAKTSDLSDPSAQAQWRSGIERRL